MSRHSVHFSSLFFLLSLLVNQTGYSNTIHEENQTMLKRPILWQTSTDVPEKLNPVNLHQVYFREKVDIAKIADELTTSANDPYEASLPMIISANLGDVGHYKLALGKLNEKMDLLNEKPENFERWMRNNSFKAWMLGRVLLSAANMNDPGNIATAKNKMRALLEEKITPEDNMAFNTWAWGYLAALNESEYLSCRKKMLDDSVVLSEKYQAEPGNHDALSNALWAWVMDLSAASAKNYKDYHHIKQKMIELTGKKSITETLETGLLRTEKSNDYPAWALAKVLHAAANMQDWALYDEIKPAVAVSIEAARQTDKKAEYALAITDNQLAIEAEKTLRLRREVPMPSAKRARITSP
ncbi:MAG TPA: hypothetical protein VLJ15_05030 [Gammaproteobacteria bacterium]|nr:hypothetical protein [Gammaproteobacteria bacterium]